MVTDSLTAVVRLGALLPTKNNDNNNNNNNNKILPVVTDSLTAVVRLGALLPTKIMTIIIIIIIIKSYQWLPIHCLQ